MRVQTQPSFIRGPLGRAHAENPIERLGYDFSRLKISSAKTIIYGNPSVLKRFTRNIHGEALG
jgi:hypothetical protein